LALLLASLLLTPDPVSEVVSSDLIQATVAAPTVTAAPELATVEYQLEVSDVNGSVPVQYWFTNDGGGGNKVGLQTTSVRQPFTTTVQIPIGNQVEIAGAVDAEAFNGQITCRILVAGTTIAQNTKSGNGAAVHCSGISFSE
jgi:hypothetical protein